MAKCVECGTDAAYGCQRCSSCSRKAFRAVLQENPELKQAFMETIEEMRRPENIKKMAEQITHVIQATRGTERRKRWIRQAFMSWH